MIKVKAIAKGQYDARIRDEGEVFAIDSMKKLAWWMEPVDQVEEIRVEEPAPLHEEMTLSQVEPRSPEVTEAHEGEPTSGGVPQPTPSFLE